MRGGGGSLQERRLGRGRRKHKGPGAGTYQAGRRVSRAHGPSMLPQVTPPGVPGALGPLFPAPGLHIAPFSEKAALSDCNPNGSPNVLDSRCGDVQ